MANGKSQNFFTKKKKGKEQWFMKKIVKTVKYPMKYTPGSTVGFEEILSSLTSIRKETLEVEEDCVLLELNRSKFLEIFEGQCLTLFKEYYTKKLATWEEDAQKRLREEDANIVQKIKFLKNAAKEGTNNCEIVVFF